MNAPAPIAATSPALRMIPLGEIAPSRTHIQELRRKRFDPKALQELADSIKAVGLLQPVVVVTSDDMEIADFELVAGERRWQAAKLAGLAEILATVRDLTPEQILEVQLIENLQREGLHELEEAEGYDELMKLKKINADAVAEMVGKSRSYVYARTKLLALCPEARKAFYAGELDASKALLVARIGHHDTQRQALKEISDRDMSFRHAQDFVQRNYMLRLSEAPFDVKADGLASAGPCGACPKRTGNQRDLFPDVKDADVCTDPKCFEAKRRAHVVLLQKDLEAKGGSIITGKDAKKICPWHQPMVLESSGWLRLDGETVIDGRYQRLDKALGKDMPVVLVEHPESGALIPVVKKAQAVKLLAAKGKKLGFASSGGGGSRSSASAQLKKARIEKEQALRVFAAAHQHLRTRRLDEADTRLVAETIFSMLGFDSQKRLVDARIAADGLPKPKGGHGYVHDFEAALPELPVAELGPLMVECAFAASLGGYRGGDELEVTAKRYGIDLKKIEAEVAAEFKAPEKAKKKGGAK